VRAYVKVMVALYLLTVGTIAACSVERKKPARVVVAG
jgi:hypothetical protein